MGRRSYTAELRQRVLDLVAAGRGVEDIAHDLGISDQTVYSWCPLRLITAPGAVEDQLLVHFCLSTVMVRRPSSCASVDVIRCPSSLAREGKSSLAAGSLTTTSSDSPIETLAIWRRNS